MIDGFEKSVLPTNEKRRLWRKFGCLWLCDFILARGEGFEV